MNRIQPIKRWNWSLAFALAVVPATAHAQLNDTCSVTANGRSVQVNEDGSFVIFNIPTGNLLIRVETRCEREGITFFGISDFFQSQAGQTFNVQDLPLTPTMPTTVFTLVATPAAGTLNMLGQTTQMTVTAEFSDGEVRDVTSRDEGTTYLSSNPAIASIDDAGLVTALGAGPVAIIASTLGATAVATVLVSPGDPLTSVEGFTLFEDGTPVAGAMVQLPRLGLATTSDATGFFSIPAVPTELGQYTVMAELMIKDVTFVGTVGVIPMPGNITDAGIITMINPGLDTDGDCVPDIIEKAVGLNPRLPDSDMNGTLDGDEDLDGDGLTNCAEVGAGTDLDDPDTDHDGFLDSDELLFAADPLDPLSTPLNSVAIGESIYGFVTIRNLQRPDVLAGDAFADPISILNTVRPDVVLGDVLSAYITTLNQAFPDVINGDAIDLPVSVLNQQLPDPNLPLLEVYDVPVTVDNEAP